MKIDLGKKDLLEILDKALADKKQILFIVLLSVMLIYADVAFVIAFQSSAIKLLGKKIVKLQSDLDMLSRDAAKIASLKVQQSLPQKGGTKKIISEQQTAYILQIISDMANDENIKILQIKPAKESPEKQVRFPGSEQLIPLSVTMDLSCDYHRLGRFINALENAEIFFCLQSMRIKSQEANFFKQDVNLVLMTYVKK